MSRQNLDGLYFEFGTSVVELPLLLVSTPLEVLAAFAAGGLLY